MKFTSSIKVLVFFFPLLFFRNLGIAQDLSKMQFDLLDESDGLSNHWIVQMMMDSSGFLWVNTMDGLNRYDGQNFKIFRHVENDSTSLQDNNGHSMGIDREGRLWVSYPQNGFGLFKEDCQCFKNYPVKVEGEKKILHFEKDGKIWFGGRGNGLNSFDPATGKLNRFNLFNIHKGYSEADQKAYNSITHIYEAPNGLFWLGTANGLYSFDPKSGMFSFKHFGPIDPLVARNDYFNYILPEGEEGFWLSAWSGGISYFDLKTEKFTTYKYVAQDFSAEVGNIVYHIVPKNKDELWLATGDKGLVVFHKKTKTFQLMGEFPLTESGKIVKNAAKLVLTKTGIMFVLTDNGLLKYDPQATLFHFNPLHIEKSQNSTFFGMRRVVEDPRDHAIYFATSIGNGLNVLDTKTGKLTAFPVEIKPYRREKFMYVMDLLLDRNNRLWVASFDFLYEYNKTKKQLVKIADPYQEGELVKESMFRIMKEDPDGDIWVITDQGGFFRFFPKEKKLSLKINRDTSQSSVPRFIERMAFDQHGRIWVAGSGGIGIYDKTTGQFFRPITPEFEKLTESGVQGMAADKFGNIWLAIHQKGLLKIKTSDEQKVAVELINEKSGLPSTRITNLEADPDGNIWMSTIMGVLYINTENNTIRVFNQTVGMDSNTFYMYFTKNKNGTFYITVPGRYCKVDYKNFSKKAVIPKVYVDNFRVFNIEKPGLLATNPIRLKPGENFFSFEFGCIDFSSASQNKFAYMLEGWDNDWVESGTRRYASFTNLDGGHYNFKVRVANSDGQWSEPVSVPIFIATPFYQKSWFAAVAALFFASIIYGLYLYRIRQIEHTEKLKTEFNRQLAESRMAALRAQMNPHFIFNCLNSINRYIIKSDIKTSSLYLTRFAKLIRLILDNSAQKKVLLSSELEALSLYIDMESLRFDHKFTFEITVDEDVDADYIEVPPLIIQPYVENAIWHGLLHKESGGHLSIKLSNQNGALKCEITDNGVGRVKAMEYKSKIAPTRKSIGMKLTEERLSAASELNSVAGTQEIIDLVDEQGEACGTKVILTIPV